jgi:hypothetical protein
MNREEDMRFKPGQKVKLKKSALSSQQDGVVSNLYPPYVATISFVTPDPHSGDYMYEFKECPWGWYESEVDCLYRWEKASNIFAIIDLD